MLDNIEQPGVENPVKVPCEMIVTYVLPTAKGALAKELVINHGMTQVQVAKIFGVTSAAVSQYLKGIRGQNSIIDKSAYRDDFYKLIEGLANGIAADGNLVEALCQVCNFVKESGLLKALYVNDGYSPEDIAKFDCPRHMIINCDNNEA